YRLQLSSSTTGADSAFSVFGGDESAVDAGTATDLLTAPGAATIRSAGDAEVVLWSGTTAEQSVHSSTNTFEELLTGVNVTVSAASTEP
ncbi:hypothetical protein ACC691_39355, partial [Rhizobium johnstonii]|uniref:hypothetical protein n=1 Tax=Rhizobium johnstonii TaxID=3019933 RepID=UPI003F944013